MNPDELSNFPFLTFGRYIDQEYLGIIGNSDEDFTTIYLYERLVSIEEKKEFLELGDKWWWETNRKIPINICFKDEWAQFKYSMITLVSSGLTIVTGPTVSLDDVGRRTRRKNYQLKRVL
jgi:hypothetical protein